MIVGIYGKDGTVLVGPLKMVSQRCKKSEYEIRQLLDGKHKWPGFTVVKLPKDAVWRL